jgi:hypothetical protein
MSTTRRAAGGLHGRQYGAAAVLAMVMAGCGPSIQSTRFMAARPEPTSGEILLYSTKLPECPYDEVGLISGKRRNFWVSMEDVLEEMKVRAREMGGHAIVGIGSGEVVTGATQSGNAVSLDTTELLTGTVVRFPEAQCRR